MKSSVARIDALVWPLIYVGMFFAMLGLAVQRDSAGLGWSLVAVGSGLTVVGVVLIWIRSRMNGGA